MLIDVPRMSRKGKLRLAVVGLFVATGVIAR
jgi:hypothetical protein